MTAFPAKSAVGSALPTSEPCRLSKDSSSRQSVRIRMYRQGFGECFLIRFHKPGLRPTHVVIDCGVMSGSPEGTARIKLASQNIREETGGVIDLVVATQEHADHLSGFNHAREVWEQITIKNLWMAWTEDLTSPEVQTAKLRQSNRLLAAIAGMAKLKAASQATGISNEMRISLKEKAMSLDSLLKFSLDESDHPSDLIDKGLSPKRIPGPVRALQWLKDRAGRNLEFCHPEHPPRSLPGKDDIKVFVLGPSCHPTSNRKRALRAEKEYFARQNLTSDICFGAAVADPSLFGLKDSAAAAPFDSFYQIKLNYDRQTEPRFESNSFYAFFDKNYGFTKDDPEAFRRIDYDWVNLAESLALSQIGHVNDSSLVLAFELTEGGPVLLFPGDGHAGSWPCWENASWDIGTGANRRKIKGRDLLKNVVFYKGSHHGAQNEMLKTTGLGRMKDPDLVAFIPVHQETAAAFHPSWKRPWAAHRDLFIKGNVAGRIILSDPDEGQESQMAPPSCAQSHEDLNRWREFHRSLTWDPSGHDLWVDYEYFY